MNFIISFSIIDGTVKNDKIQAFIKMIPVDIFKHADKYVDGIWNITIKGDERHIEFIKKLAAFGNLKIDIPFTSTTFLIDQNGGRYT